MKEENKKSAKDFADKFLKENQYIYIRNINKQPKKKDKIFSWANIKRRIFIISMYFILTFITTVVLYKISIMG
jgi:hypothetical protein